MKIRHFVPHAPFPTIVYDPTHPLRHQRSLTPIQMITSKHLIALVFIILFYLAYQAYTDPACGLSRDVRNCHKVIELENQIHSLQSK